MALMLPPNPSKPSILTLPPFINTPKSRLQSLYSDISRQKHSNPTLYHAAVEWWRRVLEGIVSSGLQERVGNREPSVLVLAANRGLIDALRVEGVGKPLGLIAVVVSFRRIIITRELIGHRTSKNELRQTKAFFSLSEFLTSRDSVYDSEWLPTRLAAYVVGKPLWWLLEQLGIVSEDGRSTNDTRSVTWSDEYVVLSLVETAADAVMSRQRSNFRGPGDALYTIEGFRNEFVLALNWAELSQQDLDVLLKFLERDRRVIVFDHEVYSSQCLITIQADTRYSERRSNLLSQRMVRRLGRSTQLMSEY